jgi:hypothetical protein
VAAGLAALVAVFLSSRTTDVLSTSTCNVHVLQDAGFDPWTGAPRPQVAMVNCAGPPAVRAQYMPPELVDQRGIPWATMLTIAAGLAGAAFGIWDIRKQVDPNRPRDVARR